MLTISTPENTHASKVGFVKPINMAFRLDIIFPPKTGTAAADVASRPSPLPRASQARLRLVPIEVQWREGYQARSHFASIRR